MLKRRHGAIRRLIRSGAVRVLVIMAVWKLFGFQALVGAAATGRLKWDSLEKTHRAAPGENKADFDYVARNDSDAEVFVTSVSTSCRCTMASFATTPYRIPPHASALLHATVYFARGGESVAQTVFVDSSAGRDVLRVNVERPGAKNRAASAAAPRP